MIKLFMTSVLLLTITFVNAQPGTFDNSFGNYGVALGPFISQVNHGNAIAQQSDGKLVVTGHNLVGSSYNTFTLRYNVNGTFDNSFGVNGVVADSMGSSADYGRAVAIQSDGKIVVAGDFFNNSSYDFFLKRYDTNGTPDPAFGNAGTATIDFISNSDDEAHAMVIQPDGKIVIAGWMDDGVDKDIALVRFLTDGSPDNTFGNNGKVHTDLSALNQNANAIALQPDGKIVITGYSFSISGGNDIIIIRYLNNGTPDSTFDADGIFMPVINTDDDAGNGIVIQPDGKIIVAGYTYTNFTYADNLIIRVDNFGVPDPTFNSTGFLIINHGNENTSTGVLLQPDGKIISVGRLFNTTLDLSMTRLLTDGNIDTTFGNSGTVTSTIALDDDHLLAAVLQSDNKIAVTGFYADSGLENLFTARYNNDTLNTSIHSPFHDSSISIFPQPAFSSIMIKGIDPKHVANIEVLSLTGKVEKHLDMTSDFPPVDISSLAPGIYFVKVSDADNEILHVARFIKIN
jgi:uncharacterized delta-60 repeat protein